MISTEYLLLSWFKTDVGYTSTYRKKNKKQLPKDLVSKEKVSFFVISQR